MKTKQHNYLQKSWGMESNCINSEWSIWMNESWMQKKIPKQTQNLGRRGSWNDQTDISSLGRRLTRCHHFALTTLPNCQFQQEVSNSSSQKGRGHNNINRRNYCRKAYFSTFMGTWLCFQYWLEKLWTYICYSEIICCLFQSYLLIYYAFLMGQ